MPCCSAFIHGDNKKNIILLGGLNHGFFELPYAEALAECLEVEGWSLVQAQLSSCGMQFGVGSLDQDAQEVQELVAEMVALGTEVVVLMGNSTGCQVSVRTVQLMQEANSELLQVLKGVILQAPVSDRETFLTHDGAAELLEKAKAMKEQGDGDAIVGRPGFLDHAPVSANRYIAFTAANGDDEMFGWELTLEQRIELTGHMSEVPVLIMTSERDEYYPPHVDVSLLTEYMAAGMGGSNCTQRMVEGADHSLSKHVELGVNAVKGWIQHL